MNKSKASQSKWKRADKWKAYLMLLPAIVLFVTFAYVPFYKTIHDSLYLVNSMGKLKEFVGFENYQRVLADKDFLRSILNTFVYAIISVPVSILISLVLAMLSRDKTKLSPVYETMNALPMAVSASACVIIFKLILNPSLGIANAVLGTNISWLTDSKWMLISIAIIGIWMNIGYNYLFLLGAVRNVPAELLESAQLDGANQLVQTARIIVPIISPTVFFLFINSLTKAMMMSGLVILLTDGGRTSSASTMISYMYSQSVLAQNYNNGYAAAVIAFCITFVFLMLSFIFEKKLVHYN